MTSGYRITLTYNLLLHGDTSRQEGDDGTVAELAGLIGEHFSTPVPRYYGGAMTDPPNRLVYLLDHEYTPRASWRRLKGADASRVALLRSPRTGQAVVVLAPANSKRRTACSRPMRATDTGTGTMSTTETMTRTPRTRVTASASTTSRG